jgi:predicted phosphodiesterase
MCSRPIRNPIALRLAIALLAFTAACVPPAPVAVDPAAVARAKEAKSSLPNADGAVKFLVIGDSGTGDAAQYAVASMIAAWHQRFEFDFAIMLGDNLYGSESPAAYEAKFAIPYKPLLDAGVDFYAALGNHDEPSQRFYEPFNMGEQRYYTHEHGNAEFFVLDSTYMTPQQVDWLKKELTESDAEWKIPYMHHPMYSSGERHGSERDLQALLEPMFLETGVDVVFAGHEHFYERLRPQKGITYITQGGAAKLRRGNITSGSPMTADGFDTDRSFTLAEIVDDRMYIETISRLGEIVDSAVITRREATGARPSE